MPGLLSNALSVKVVDYIGFIAGSAILALKLPR